MRKPLEFPLVISENGVSAKIRRVTKKKAGAGYTSYVVDYMLLGKRRQEWRADLDQAKEAARRACIDIANGEQLALELRNEDRLAYLRACEALGQIGTPIDSACREYAEAIGTMNGKGNLLEAVRFYVKAHNVELPRVPVSQAVDEMIAQARRDGKSQDRVHQLETYLHRFKDAFNCHVTDLNSKVLTDFIVAMPVKERTKKNCRDVLKAFCAWCAGRGYLPKDQTLMNHVPNYRARKIGEIEIFTPDEMIRLLAAADPRLVPYLAIQAFAGVRGKEIQRLDWSNIDFEDGFIEVAAGKSKTDLRRLVPIKDNLKEWLRPHAKTNGPVCPFKNLSNQLTDLANASKVEWRKNALRHSYISYRVAECADLPRVADESGNSVAVIRTNYLRRVKPAQAGIWFNIRPEADASEKIVAFG